MPVVVGLHQDVAEMFTVGKNRTAIQLISFLGFPPLWR
jgi:hypothetical protein